MTEAPLGFDQILDAGRVLWMHIQLLDITTTGLIKDPQGFLQIQTK
jgi:hypothetical protein